MCNQFLKNNKKNIPSRVDCPSMYHKYIMFIAFSTISLRYLQIISIFPFISSIHLYSLILINLYYMEEKSPNSKTFAEKLPDAVKQKKKIYLYIQIKTTFSQILTQSINRPPYYSKYSTRVEKPISIEQSTIIKSAHRTITIII